MKKKTTARDNTSPSIPIAKTPFLPAGNFSAVLAIERVNVSKLETELTHKPSFQQIATTSRKRLEAIEGNTLIDMDFVLQNLVGTLGVKLAEENYDEFSKMLTEGSART